MKSLFKSDYTLCFWEADGVHEILKGMLTYTKTDIICVATLLLIITRIYGWKKKDIFMKLYFWITFSSFCMVAAFAAGNLADYGIISMCR